MNFISKIPRSAFIALFATIGFTLICFFVVGSLNIRPPVSKLIMLLVLFLNFLPGIVSAGVVWFAMRKTHKNAWAIAIITGFAMLGLFEVIAALIGPIFGYIAMLPVTWGLLIMNSRIFSSNKRTILTFCVLFIFCAALWLAGYLFSTWMLHMRVETLFNAR